MIILPFLRTAIKKPSGKGKEPEWSNGQGEEAREVEALLFHLHPRRPILLCLVKPGLSIYQNMQGICCNLVRPDVTWPPKSIKPRDVTALLWRHLE